MKRVYKSPATPERLCSYVKAFPDETWDCLLYTSRDHGEGDQSHSGGGVKVAENYQHEVDYDRGKRQYQVQDVYKRQGVCCAGK